MKSLLSSRVWPTTEIAKDSTTISMMLSHFRMLQLILIKTFVNGLTNTAQSSDFSKLQGTRLKLCGLKYLILVFGLIIVAEFSVKICLKTIMLGPTTIMGLLISRAITSSLQMLKKILGNGLACASLLTHLVVRKQWLQPWLTVMTVATVLISTHLQILNLLS